MKTIKIDTFEGFDFGPYFLPCITIYKDPIDFPNCIVARLFDLDTPTEFAMVKTSLAEIDNSIPISFAFIERSKEDPPQIIGTFA